MAPKIKLTYFDVRARAELSRIILAQAGVEYEDCRIKGEEWQKMKPNSLFGGLPELEFDGERLGQSMSIARFLATEFGLTGRTNVERAKCDGIVDAGIDMANAGFKFRFEKDEAKKKELEDKFMENDLTKFLGTMEKILNANGGEYMVGCDLTWADIATAVNLSHLTDMFKVEWEAKSPKLAAFQKKIYSLPNIKKWIDTRPNNSM